MSQPSYYSIKGKFHSGKSFTLLVKGTFTDPNKDDITAFAEDYKFDLNAVALMGKLTPVSSKKFNYLTDGQALNMASYVGWICHADGGLYECSKPSKSIGQDVSVILTNINFKLLRSQKKQLLKVMNNQTLVKKEVQALEGILNLIDAVQDYAVDNKLLSEHDVFSFGKKSC